MYTIIYYLKKRAYCCVSSSSNRNVYHCPAPQKYKNKKPIKLKLAHVL